MEGLGQSQLDSLIWSPMNCGYPENLLSGHNFDRTPFNQDTYQDTEHKHSYQDTLLSEHPLAGHPYFTSQSVLNSWRAGPLRSVFFFRQYLKTSSVIIGSRSQLVQRHCLQRTQQSSCRTKTKQTSQHMHVSSSFYTCCLLLLLFFLTRRTNLSCLTLFF